MSTALAARSVARSLTPIAQAVGARGLAPPSDRLLSPHRRAAAEAALARHLPEARALAFGVMRGNAGAREALSSLVDTAVAETRAGARSRALDAGGLAAWAARVDGWFHDPDATEILDDPGVDRDVRARVVGHLDALNHALGNYRAFRTSVRPFLTHRTRVLDLASGHAGFAIELARDAVAEGHDVRVHATDLFAEYLALGEPAARGLPVTFGVQDALDLGGVDYGDYDVVTCTQSLHHFRPGQVAVMLAQAARVASRAVVFVDGARCASAVALVTALGLVAFGDRVWAHDTVASFRRFFVAEELDVVARLALPAWSPVTSWVAPGHVRVVVGPEA